jgi:AcrR family transcriptional regulator
MVMKKINATVKPKRVRRDRKEEILEKTTVLFGQYGFQGTTLALIAEAVGLSEPGVLHYFPSKVHLLQGVLEYRDQHDLEKYSKLAESEKNSVSEFFQPLEDIVTQNEKIPGLIQLFTVLVSESIRGDHPSHDYFVDRYRRGRDIYVNQFLKVDKSNIRNDVNLDELAALIMAVMDGLQIQWLLDPKKVNMVDTFKLFSKIVVEYLEIDK